MNELTRNLTTSIPDRNPTTRTGGEGDHRREHGVDAGLGLEPAHDDEREGEHRPAREVEGAGGQRHEDGEAEDADDDLVAEHDLERGLGQERVGDPQPEDHEDQRQQVQHARPPRPGSRFRRRRADGRGARHGRGHDMAPSSGSASRGSVDDDDVGRAERHELGLLDALAGDLGRRAARRSRRRAAARSPASTGAPARRCPTSTRPSPCPLADARSTRRWMSALDPTSTPCVGSSSTSTRGVQRNQRAITTFCWLPPDSSPMIASVRAGRTSSSSIQSSASCFSAPRAASDRRTRTARGRRSSGSRAACPCGTARRWPGRPAPRTARRRSPLRGSNGRDRGARRRRPRRCAPGGRTAGWPARRVPSRSARRCRRPRRAHVEVDRRQLGAADAARRQHRLGIARRRLDPGVGGGLGDQLAPEHQVGEALVGELDARSRWRPADRRAAP